MNNIHIHLIRHAQSIVNASKEDIIGQDPMSPLSEKGVKQAVILGKRFREQKITFDFVHCSTMLRAKHTALLALGDDKDTYYTKALIEYDPGELKGKKRKDVYSDPTLAIEISMKSMGYPFKNGETLHQCARRAAKHIEDMIIYNDTVLALVKERDVNIAVFSHGQTIKSIAHYIMGFDQSFLWKIRLDNTSICHFVYNDNGWFLRSLNDTAHLAIDADEEAKAKAIETK